MNLKAPAFLSSADDPVHNMRVVIAEDSSVARSAASRMLTKLGHIVVAECANAAEAIRACEEHRPDLAILDISMPGSNGMQHIDKIIESRSASRVIIASILVGTGKREFDEYRNRGVVTLAKPFDEVLLRRALQEIERST
jgi:two-component system, LytTR family, response regulator AlgR